MKTELKHKMLTAVLALLLLVSLVYITIGQFNSAQEKKIMQIAGEAYQTGVADAVRSAYTQTANCQVATITLFNQTRQIVDVACIRSQEAAQPEQKG